MTGIILNYTTEIAAKKSLGEISSILLELGATNISIKYDRETKTPTDLAFTISTPVGDREFDVPARIEKVQAILKDGMKLAGI